MEESEGETDRQMDREDEWESGNDTVRDTARASWEEKSDRGRGRRGVITLATLTRRRPDSRSRSTRSARLRPHLHAYTRFTSSPPPYPSSPFPTIVLHHPARAPLQPPASLPFLRLPFPLSWFPISFLRFFHVVRGAVHPSSLLDRRTRKHQHQNDRTIASARSLTRCNSKI